MDGFAARNTTAAMTRRADGFSVKPKTTGKPRHKDDRARVTTHALAEGRTGKVQDRRLAEPLEPPVEAMDQRVPEVPKHEGDTEQARERVRRDIGSHVLVFELGAPGSPEEVPDPFGDARGITMHWAAHCTTHDETRYFAEHRRALQAAKTSHTWCPGCAEAVAATRRTHNRAHAQTRKST